MPYLTCPAWKSVGHRSSFQEWNQPQGDRCDRAFSGHNGIPDTLPGHHGKGSRKHQIPPLGWHQSDSHPSIQPCKIQANHHRTFRFKDSFQIGFTLWLLALYYLLCPKHNILEDCTVLLMNSTLLKHWKVCPENPKQKCWPALKEKPTLHSSVMSKAPASWPQSEVTWWRKLSPYRCFWCV